MNGKSRICTGWGAVLFGLALGLSLIPIPPVEAQCQYEVTIIQGPDCPPPSNPPATIGTGINDLGYVVGYYSQCGGGTGNEPFLWTPESGLITLDRPPDTPSAEPWDINDGGQIVGTLDPPGPSGQQGFIWQSGQWTILPPDGDGISSGASANNNAGQVVGYRDIELFTRHGLLWSEGLFTDIAPTYGETLIAADVNQTPQVVGWMGTSTFDRHAFLWEAGEVTDLGAIPGGLTGSANAINSLGQIVIGGKFNPDEPPNFFSGGFLWEEGEWTNLGMLPGYDSMAVNDINDLAQVVGWSRAINSGNLPDHAFVWKAGVMSDLNDLIHPNQALIIKRAEAVNSAGQITGWANYQGNTVAMLLTPVNFPLADLNGDCVVNPFDLALLLASWGPCEGCPADLNADGVVNPEDLAMLLGNWG